MADAIGVPAAQLTAGSSLSDDLAVYWLDLLELANVIEENLDVSLPDSLLRAVETYGDLEALVLDRSRHPPGTAEAPLVARTRVIPSDSRPGAIERADVITPYAVENIAADARRMGRGTCVQITVPAASRPPAIAALRWMFSGLAASGVVVRIDRDEGWRY